MVKILANFLLCLGAGLLWWVGNIQMGNVKALEWLGWLAAYPWYVSWVVASQPSISQLFITESWTGSKKGQEPEPIDPLSMVFAGFVAIVIDLGGPMLGFFVVTGLSFDMWTLAAAIIIAAFVSILCQHVAWVRGKATLAAIAAIFDANTNKRIASKQKTVQEQAPHPLHDRIAQYQVQSANGREKANANPTQDQ